jgi:hypothetical protein
LCTGASIASIAKDGAATLKGFSQNSAYVAIAELNKRATRVTRGAISLSNSTHLPACVGSAAPILSGEDFLFVAVKASQGGTEVPAVELNREV